MRKNRSYGVSPASEPRQLLLGQQNLCRLEAGATFFLTTTEYTETHGEPRCRCEICASVVKQDVLWLPGSLSELHVPSGPPQKTNDHDNSNRGRITELRCYNPTC